MSKSMRDNYWDKDWADYTLPGAFIILGVLLVITMTGLIGALYGWW